MKTRDGLLISLAGVFLLSGCSAWQTQREVRASSYQRSHEIIPRNVGRLRRLVPVLVYQSAPPVCVPGDAPSETRLAAQHPFLAYSTEHLRGRLGYDVHAPVAAAYEAWRSETDPKAFAHEIVEWFENTEEDAAIGPEVTKYLAQVVSAENREDGLLLLFKQDTCLEANTTVRTLMALSTMGFWELIPAINDDAKRTHRVRYTKYYASIIEVATQRPVWRNQVGLKALAPDPSAEALQRTITPADLFEELEPALPAILAR